MLTVDGLGISAGNVQVRTRSASFVDQRFAPKSFAADIDGKGEVTGTAPGILAMQ